MGEHAVSVQNLTKRFTKVLALDQVSFDVPTGSVFGLLGPNGAGKTTLFSIAAGFLKKSSGAITVLGHDVQQIGELRGRFSMLPQDARFQGAIPVIDQLIMFGRLTGHDPAGARKAAEEALEIVGLGEVARRAARTLSHGMMKRVALCQAFIGNPEVIFLDEPTAGLDPENARNIRNLVRDNAKDRTVIFSSHNLQEVQDICSHICILNEGKVIETGTLEELTRAAHLLRILLPAGIELTASTEQALLALEHVASVERTGHSEFNLRLDLQGPEQKELAMRSLYQTLVANELYPDSILQGASLEARFLELTGGVFDGASSS